VAVRGLPPKNYLIKLDSTLNINRILTADEGTESSLADEEATGDFASIATSNALRKHVRHVTLDTRLEDYGYV
jgi:hypothetical protein